MAQHHVLSSGYKYTVHLTSMFSTQIYVMHVHTQSILSTSEKKILKNLILNQIIYIKMMQSHNKTFSI